MTDTPNRPADDRTLDEILRQLEIDTLEVIGDEFAPKVEGGSEERKRLLGLIGKTTPLTMEAKAALRRWHTAELRMVLERLRIQATVNTFNEDDSSEEYDYTSVPIEAINTELNKLEQTQ